MSEPSVNIADKERKIADNSIQADLALGKPVNKIATSNEGVTRIKGTDLLSKNLNEPHWPGVRTHFQIDRDQILFNTNFVRLARKTQVFIGQGDALYKNRLMHSLEVVQFSQSVARGSQDPFRPALNPDLVEAIAYGHDIGHTPFGHAGEETLNACLYEYHVREILKDIPKYARCFDSSPCVHPTPRNNESEKVRIRDHALWTFVEIAVRRYPETHVKGVEPLTRQEAEALLGMELISELSKLNVLHSDDEACYFNPPYTWRWDQGKVDRIQREFWIDEKSRDFFAHNVHALRVLLADNERPKSDISYHTAWGILTHTPRKYSKFTCFLPSCAVDLTDNFETPEAFLVRQADDICFANSDLEDARRGELIKWRDLDVAEREAIWGLAEFSRHVGSDFPDNSQRLQFCEQGFHFVEGNASSYANTERINRAREVIRKKVYPFLSSRQEAAKRIIRDLFWFYSCPLSREERRAVDDAALKERDSFFKKRKMEAGTSSPRVATDFIAYMTDEEVIDTHRALYSPEHARWSRYFMKSGQDG